MRLLAGIPLLVALATQAAEVPMRVNFEGNVSHPGGAALPINARYADGAIAAWPTQDAYLAGADLLRPSLVEDQVRLKAGIVDSLSLVAADAGRDGNDAMADTARRMVGWIKSLPVTGRNVVALLDPRVVEITPASNLHLADGDTLRFPGRPTTIRIVGAVAAECQVDFVPLQDALRYLAQCTQTRAADIEVFYVIQPDGTVFQQGRALWNRSEPQALAPGATLYVPLKTGRTARIDADLDRDIARFIATQVLP